MDWSLVSENLINTASIFIFIKLLNHSTSGQCLIGIISKSDPATERYYVDTPVINV